MPKIRATTIEEHKEQTRDEILAWAEKLFVSQGYNDTSLTEVADAVGIGRTTMYEYFPNKDHLVVGLVESVVTPRLLPILTDLPPGNRERIVFMLEQVLTAVGEFPELTQLVFRVGRKLPTALQTRMWETLDPMTGEIAACCARGVLAGEFAHEDPALLGRAIADMFTGAIEEVLRAESPKSHVPGVFATYSAFLDRGLGTGNAVNAQ